MRIPDINKAEGRDSKWYFRCFLFYKFHGGKPKLLGVFISGTCIDDDEDDDEDEHNDDEDWKSRYLTRT